MSKTTGLVLDPEVSVDVEPGVVTLYDRSRFANNGVFTNAPTWVRLPSGLFVLNLVAGSNQYIEITDAPSLSLTNVISLEVWFNTTTIAATWQMVLGKRGAAVANYYFGLGLARLIFGYYVGAWRTFATTLSYVSTNTWYHLAVTFDPNTNDMMFYLNGDWKETIADAFSLIANSENVRIGCAVTGEQNFDGRIWSPRIYTYVLTPGQILQRYEATRRLFGV